MAGEHRVYELPFFDPRTSHCVLSHPTRSSTFSFSFNTPRLHSSLLSVLFTSLRSTFLHFSSLLLPFPIPFLFLIPHAPHSNPTSPIIPLLHFASACQIIENYKHMKNLATIAKRSGAVQFVSEGHTFKESSTT